MTAIRGAAAAITGAASGIGRALALELVLRHSDYDWLILSQFRMGRCSGATRIWMLLATPD